MFELEGDKSLGMEFFKRCWGWVNVMRFFMEFYEIMEISQSMNLNFIHLIPKKEDSRSISDISIGEKIKHCHLRDDFHRTKCFR